MSLPPPLICLAVFFLGCLVGSFYSHLLTPFLQDQSLSAVWKGHQEDEAWRANSKEVGMWRDSLQKAIEEGNSTQVEELKRSAFPVHNVLPCKYTFLDFGSNVGDSFRKFVDSSFPELNKKRPKLDVKTGEVGNDCYGCDGKRTMDNNFRLPEYVRKNLENGTKPEDYCFYGVEGNPVFTARLQEIELKTMSMRPRPVRHIHFFTEHVGAKEDGPTVLYLDTINAQHNFWGSSIFASHYDIRRNSNVTAANVTGITLTTLLSKIAVPNGHVMIKIDIEGAEYDLLTEALESNILCKLTSDGVRITMLMEPHNDRVVGSSDPAQKWKALKGNEKIKNCGVEYTTGDGGR